MKEEKKGKLARKREDKHSGEWRNGETRQRRIEINRSDGNGSRGSESRQCPSE